MDDYYDDYERGVQVRRRDRLSELPNSLIHLILSLLPIRDVVSTALLSKRWKNIWTTVPTLNFCNLTQQWAETEAVRDFVNRVLILWRGPAIPKFKLDIHWNMYKLFPDDIDLWMRFAVENRVEQLNIRLRIEKDMQNRDRYAYTTPPCLNSCSSLKELSLVGCILRTPVSPSWDRLRSLKLDGFLLDESLVNRILLGSPQLEEFELRLKEDRESLNIRSTSLKKLKIEKYLGSDNGFYEPSKDKVVRIHCPNLEMLALSGALYSKYLFTDISSLTDVTLRFSGWYAYVGKHVEETLKQVFATFQHLDKVTLSYWCVQVLGALQSNNLITSSPNVKFFPNVKMLVIEACYEHEFEPSDHQEYERNLSKSFMLQLKTVNITSALDSTSTFRFIKCLLKNASMLEKLVIRAKMIDSADWFKVAERLLCLPRSSTTAKVILKKY